jgi:hypothetical protein
MLRHMSRWPHTDEGVISVRIFNMTVRYGTILNRAIRNRKVVEELPVVIYPAEDHNLVAIVDYFNLAFFIFSLPILQ